MRLVSVGHMMELENQANQAGLSYGAMMANAGRKLAEFIHQKYQQVRPLCVTGLVGQGNNGGDTLIALTHLLRMGWKAYAYLIKPRQENEKLLKDFLHSGGRSALFQEDSDFHQLQQWMEETDLLLDGILGTGFRLPLIGEALEVLTALKRIEHRAAVIAVDCPSGVDCDNGQASEMCLKADLTVCMAAVKRGLVMFPAFNFVGEITTIDIGLPIDLPGWMDVHGEVLNAELVKSLLPERPKDGHKGTFGSCLIIAGSVQYCGAVLLACEAAYRMGAGLVQAAVPASIYPIIAGSLPEVIWLLLPEEKGAICQDGHNIIRDQLNRKTIVLLGPGWGTSSESEKFLHYLLDIDKNEGIQRIVKQSAQANGNILPPLVIDADAIKLLAAIPDWHKKIPEGSVITPHPGEMSVLTGEKIEALQSDRIGSAVRYACAWGLTVVLKGACTVVANAQGSFAVVPLACSALAKAGSGDVLAGMITALMAQGVDGFSAAKAAAWLHAQAGILAAINLGSERCVLARDVIANICLAIKKNTGCK